MDLKESKEIKLCHYLYLYLIKVIYLLIHSVEEFENNSMKGFDKYFIDYCFKGLIALILKIN